MALNIILTCVIAVNAFNFLLVLDLYGRTNTLAKLAGEARANVRRIIHILSQVTKHDKSLRRNGE
jgi:hypothetical protein